MTTTTTQPSLFDQPEQAAQTETLADAGRRALDAVYELFGLKSGLDELLKRRLGVGDSPDYCGMAANLLVMDAIDECEGEEINDDRWLVHLATIGALALLDELEWQPYLERDKAQRRAGLAEPFADTSAQCAPGDPHPA